MKTIKYLSVVLLVFSAFLVGAQQKDQGSKIDFLHNEGEVSWISKTIELGNIEQGKPASVYFEFENTGNEPITIQRVQAGCGCTVVDYSKEPILPGESAKIKATYNAKVKGAFSKSVKVYTNDKISVHTVWIKGKVI